MTNVKMNIGGQGVVQELGEQTEDGHILAYRSQDEDIYENIPPPMPYLPTSPLGSRTKRVKWASDLCETLKIEWKCQGCHLVMPPGSVAVFAERSNHGNCWHPACFTCTTCGQWLEDLLYYFSKGKLYCGRDFAALMNIPRCNACDELIFSEEFTKAEGGFWHLDHFCCWFCERQLAGEKYLLSGEGQPHCEDCWGARWGKTCRGCHELIRPGQERVSIGRESWHDHPSCYHCTQCHAGLSGRKVSRTQEGLVCSSSCSRKLSMSIVEKNQKLSSCSNQSYSEPIPSHLRPYKPLKRIDEELRVTQI